jgi:peroxiredoxin
MTKIFAFLLVTVLIASCSPAFLAEPAPEVSAHAPDFTLQTLDGETVSLSDLRGQMVLINFWATWCGPCKLEMPIIQARYNDRELVVLAINFNENAERVQMFVDDLELTFPILLDPGGSIQELYRVRGYPTSYFVDADGVIRILHIGDMTEETIDQYLTYMEELP